MVSRKEVQAHIQTKLYLTHFDLDVILIDLNGNPCLKIVNRTGIEKVFKSTKAAKSWITRLDNKELCRRVDLIV